MIKKSIISLLSVLFVLSLFSCKHDPLLPDESFGSVTGKVTYSNAEDSSDISVIIRKVENNVASDTAWYTKTDAEGLFTIDDVVAGSYVLYIASDISVEKAVERDITITSDEITAIEDIALTATGSVTGKITLDESETESYGFTVSIPETSYSAVTGKSGKYTISGVPSGSQEALIIQKGDYTYYWETEYTVPVGSAVTLDTKNFSSNEIVSTNGNMENTESVVVKNGTDGKDGASMTWLGSYDSVSKIQNPKKLDAYYNITDGCSYIYDGSQWTLLASKGDKGETGESYIEVLKEITFDGRYDNISTYLTLLPENDKEHPYKFICTGGLSALSSVTMAPTKYYILEFGDFTSQTALPADIQAGSEGLVSVVLSSSIKSIGNNAFKGCTNLKTITISESVTSIGSNVFEDCVNVSQFVIPKSVTSIGSNAFFGCKSPIIAYTATSSKFSSCLSEFTGELHVIIPDSVTSIGYSAFSNCSQMTSITIPDTVTSIGSYAFKNCSGLTTLIIPSSVSSIGSDAFDGCSFELHANTASGTIYKSSSINGFTGDFYLTIPDSVAEIASEAFLNFGIAIKEITIPNSVTSIGSSAFKGCFGLANVTIPNSVTSIGDSAFYNCPGLKNITLPDSITSIGNSAFGACTGLTNIIIPNSITSIGDSVFSNCNNLTNITIPNSVTAIGSYAFSGCTNLTSMTIPDSVTSIGRNTFSDCKNLSRLIISDSVVSFGKYICDNCSENLIVYSSNLIVFDQYILSDSTTPVKVNYVIPRNTINIEEKLFYQKDLYANLVGITIPATVKSICSDAFHFYDSYKSGTIIPYPDVYVTSLESFLSIEFLGEYSNPLNKGAKLYINDILATNITIPDSFTIIKENLLSHCTSISNVIIPNSITSIGSSAFSGCTSLTTITIPDSVIFIESGAFSGCTSLTSVTIPDSITSIGSSAFYNCTSLKNINIPNSVTSIGRYAFSNCSSLINIVIPSSVTSEGGWGTFKDCTSLENLTILGQIEEFDREYARYCTSLKTLTLPATTNFLGWYSFDGCTSLEKIYFAGTEEQWNNIRREVTVSDDDFDSVPVIFNYHVN